MKKSQRRKLIISISGIILAILIIIGAVFGIKAIINKSQNNDGNVAKASHKTLKLLEENAEKLRKGSEEFYDDPECKFDYPAGQFLIVEVNEEGKLVVTASGFNADALAKIVKKYEIEVGADIGITAKAYIISFDKDKNVNIKKSEEDKLKEDLITTEENSVSVNEERMKKVTSAANIYLDILKKYLKENDITKLNGSIYIYTNSRTKKLEVYPIVIGLTDEQLDEIYNKAAEKISFDEKLGFSKYGYRIDLDNTEINMVMQEEREV